MSNKTEKTSKKQGLEMKYKVGDLVVPADGSSYVGEITYISQEEDTVRHKCLRTGTEYEKSYYGFPVRYMSIVEMLESRRKLSKENTDMHTERYVLGEILAVIHGDGGHHTEAVGIPQSVADAHAVWAALVAERDKAVAEASRLNAQLEIITAENHSRARREARSLEDWANLRAEAERMRNALRKLLLSRDASWTGGHDWQEAVDDAIKALGMEVGG